MKEVLIEFGIFMYSIVFVFYEIDLILIIIVGLMYQKVLELEEFIVVKVCELEEFKDFC